MKLNPVHRTGRLNQACYEIKDCSLFSYTLFVCSLQFALWSWRTTSLDRTRTSSTGPGPSSNNRLEISRSSVATIFGPPRKQIVWAHGQGVTATTSSWQAPGGPLAGPFSPAGPPAVAGPAGPSLRHWSHVAILDWFGKDASVDSWKLLRSIRSATQQRDLVVCRIFEVHRWKCFGQIQIKHHWILRQYKRCNVDPQRATVLNIRQR